MVSYISKVYSIQENLPAWKSLGNCEFKYMKATCLACITNEKFTPLREAENKKSV
jgi:hypothetical protein